MGAAVRALVEADRSIVLRACVAGDGERGAGPPGCDWIEASSFGAATLEALPRDTVVLDVSLPAGTGALVSALERAPRAAVIATTGLDPRCESRVAALAATAPLFRARNLSLGVAVAKAWLRSLAPAAREAFVADVLEQHHAEKKDAPSGTALDLVAALGAMAPGKRPGGVVPTHSIRAGTVPGTHRVILSGDGETLEIVHTVHDRSVFAAGALRAVRFLHGRPPGTYTVDDLLASSATP